MMFLYKLDDGFMEKVVGELEERRAKAKIADDATDAAEAEDISSSGEATEEEETAGEEASSAPEAWRMTSHAACAW